MKEILVTIDRHAPDMTIKAMLRLIDEWEVATRDEDAEPVTATMNLMDVGRLRTYGWPVKVIGEVSVARPALAEEAWDAN